MYFYNYPQFHGIFSSGTLSLKPLWYSDMSLVSLQVNQYLSLTQNKNAFSQNHSASEHVTSLSPLERGIIGVGNDYSPQIAYQKAYSEAVERACCRLMIKRDIITDTPERLEKNGVSFAVPHKNLDKDLPISFTTVLPLCSLERQRHILYPATHVYLGVADNTCCHESISSGMAAHMTFENATLSGLLELIERDSFVIFWLTRSGFSKLNITTYFANKRISKMYSEITRAGISINLYDISSDLLVPSVLCYLNQSIFPYNLISTAAGLTYEGAIEHCMSEALLGLISYTLIPQEIVCAQFCDSRGEMRDKQEFPTGGPIRLHSDWYACDPKKTIAFSFLRDSDRCFHSYRAREFSSMQELSNHLVENGVNIYYKAIDSSHLFSCNRSVVSLVSPDLVPLYNNESKRPTDNIRLARLIEKARALNDWPHPFP